MQKQIKKYKITSPAEIAIVEWKYTLNRIQARIVDLNNFSPQPTLDELNKNTIDIGTLDPGRALVTQNRLKLDKNKGVNLNVFFGANNGYTIQTIKMQFVKDKWLRYEEIRRLDGKKLFSKVDPNFPNPDEKPETPKGH